MRKKYISWLYAELPDLVGRNILSPESANCAMVGKSITEGKGISKYDRKRVVNESYIQLNQQRYESR